MRLNLRLAAIQHGALAFLAVAGVVSAAEAKIVIADGSSAATSAVDPPFKPDPPPKIQREPSSFIGYQLFGATPSWSYGATPFIGPGTAGTLAITRSVRNDAIRLRLLRNAEQRGLLFKGNH
jgi:hypothetical protein